MISEYWLSCPKMTINVAVKHGVIVKAPPIAKKFIGQSLKNLVDWMRHVSDGVLQVEKIK